MWHPNGVDLITPPTGLWREIDEATRSSDLDTLGQLLEEWQARLAPEPLTPDHLQYPLGVALQRQQLAAVEYLLHRGASFSGKTVTWGFDSLDQNVAIYQLLLTHGWDINSLTHRHCSSAVLMYENRSTPAHTLIVVRRHAVKHPQLLEWCLANGADPNLRDGWRKSPIDAAARTSTPDAIRRLIRAGADIATCSPLHAAAERHSGSVEMMGFLLEEYQVDINAISVWKGAREWMRNRERITHYPNAPGTALHRAIDRENYPAVEFLLKNGASPMAPNIRGQTAIDWAEKWGNDEIKALLSKKQVVMAVTIF